MDGHGHNLSSQRGAADLTNILNSPPTVLTGGSARGQGDQRDSAYSSKHTSGASFNGGSNVLSPTGTGFPSALDKLSSPWPDARSNSALSNGVLSPSASNMSVASMVSPVAFGSADPPRLHDRPMSIESGNHYHHHHHGDDNLAPGHLQPESRRQSVDSRFNQQMDNMELGGGSPYTSQNTSTTSFNQNQNQSQNQNLAVQRTSLANRDSLAAHRISNGYQPNAQRAPDMNSKLVRTAPAITGPATGTIARAAEPTKGQAWAFPEMETQQGGSRRSSTADSLASSQFTDSRLPPGQMRLNNGSEYGRMSEDLKSIPQTFQHRQVAELLQDDDMGLGNGQQPYSRTPELRVSHKLAERKRRTEMKELFEQLRELMPQERGAKASKWEILTKAIAEYQRLTETNRSLQHHLRVANHDNNRLRQEIQKLRMEASRPHPDSNSGHRNSHPQHTQSMYGSHEQYSHSPRHDQLPPLRHISNSVSSVPESMSGVQYEQSRHSLNGYRP